MQIYKSTYSVEYLPTDAYVNIRFHPEQRRIFGTSSNIFNEVLLQKCCKKYSFKWTLLAQKCRDKKFVEQQLDHLVTLDPSFIVDLYFSLCFADYHLFPNFQCFLGIFPMFVKSKKSSNKV